MDLRLLAQAILDAQAKREQSWDEKTHTYGKTVHQAAMAVCKDGNLGEMVSMLNYALWNDAQFWAQKVLS